MTITVYPLNYTPGGVEYTAQQGRQTLAALMMGGPGPLRTRTGFRPGGQPSVSVDPTTWTVGPFTAIVDTGQSTVTGPYLVASDGPESGDMTPAHSTYDRRDILFVRVDDDDEADGSGERRGVVEYLEGVPAAVPSAPATPPRSLLIGTIDVPRTGLPSFTPFNMFTVAAGGIVPSYAAGDPPTAHRWRGQVFARADLDQLWYWDGTQARKVWDANPPVYTSSGITYPSGARAIQGDALRYRVLPASNEIELHGGVESTTRFGADGVTVAMLPAGALPAQLTYWSVPVTYSNFGGSANEGTARAEVHLDGSLRLYARTSVTWVRFHKLRFERP